MGKQVLVVGAGASGMMAAIQAARAGAVVTVLEHRDRAGKKLSATGNGRCNLTNLDQRPEYYRCGAADFPGYVLRQFPVEETLAFFRELGILPKDRNGYIYPNSDQAASVVTALLGELEQLSVTIVYQCQIDHIEKEQGIFRVFSDQGVYRGDSLILAAGSKAAHATGSDGSGYELAAAFGHRIVTPLPALVQLRCGKEHDKRLAGVRSDGEITLYGDGKRLAFDKGELQLTDYGISGIPAFQVSRYASVALHRRQKVTAVINFLPVMRTEEAERFLTERLELMKKKGRSCGQFMNGLLNSKLSGVLLAAAGIWENQKAETLTEKQKTKLFRLITSYEAVITDVNPFENAQVCCGGVDVKQVQRETLESKLVKGLYFCGEILDVDGICGGYNLQWAWSSGAVAGWEAAGDLSQEAAEKSGREAAGSTGRKGNRIREHHSKEGRNRDREKSSGIREVRNQDRRKRSMGLKGGRKSDSGKQSPSGRSKRGKKG